MKSKSAGSILTRPSLPTRGKSFSDLFILAPLSHSDLAPSSPHPKCISLPSTRTPSPSSTSSKKQAAKVEWWTSIISVPTPPTSGPVSPVQGSEQPLPSQSEKEKERRIEQVNYHQRYTGLSPFDHFAKSAHIDDDNLPPLVVTATENEGMGKGSKSKKKHNKNSNTKKIKPPPTSTIDPNSEASPTTPTTTSLSHESDPPHDAKSAFYHPFEPVPIHPAPPSYSTTHYPASYDHHPKHHHREREEEPRGRSRRPRLLWCSQLDGGTIRELDERCRAFYGVELPVMRGDGSEDGERWSRELDEAGL